MHGQSHSEVDQLLRDMLFHVQRIPITRRIRGEASDPDDDLVLEAAVNGLADAIVTHNVRHLRQAAMARRIAVLTPAAIFNEGGI